MTDKLQTLIENTIIITILFKRFKYLCKGIGRSYKPADKSKLTLFPLFSNVSNIK